MKQAYTSAAIGGALLLTVMFAPVLGYFPYDARLLSAWNQGPTTPIVDVAPGTEMKISGVLSSPGSVALGGAQRSGYAWSWNTTDVFTINDASGAATVTVESFWLILPATHVASWAVTSSGQPDYAATYYAPGDRVTVLGVVGAGSGTLRTVSVLIMGPSGTSVTPPAADFFLPILGFGLLGILWAWVLASVADRAVVHHRKVRGATPQPVGSEADQKDASVEWYPNPQWMSTRPRLFAGLVAGGLGAWAVGLGFYLLLPVGIFAFMLIDFFVIVLGMASYLGVYLWVFRPATPSAIAFSERGFHFWYDSPYDRELHDDLIPWDTLQAVTVVPLPKGGKAWMMRRKDGEVDNLAYLTVANRDAAVAAWELHAPKAPAAAHAGAGEPEATVPVIPPDHATVVLRRGTNYQFSVMLIAFGGIFAFAIAVRGITLDPTDPFYPSEMAGDILIGAFFWAIFLVGVIGAVRTRPERSLVVDPESVQLFRGDERIRNIAWAHVAKVGCGLKMGRAVSYCIDVYGRRGEGSIRVNSWVFRTSREEMTEVGDLILSTARERGIPAEAYALAKGTPGP